MNLVMMPSQLHWNKSKSNYSLGTLWYQRIKRLYGIYQASPFTPAQQIETLKQRGPVIEGENEAIAILDRTSYFRLADY